MPADSSNPFAAPAVRALPWPSREGAIAAHARSVARWMRFLGVLYYVASVVVALGSIAAFIAMKSEVGAAFIVSGIGLVVTACLLALGHWLFRGGTSIRSGVLGGFLGTLASGLRDAGLHFTLLAIGHALFVAISILVLVL
jgi:hypothetical protein